jgi:hypothetical protein
MGEGTTLQAPKLAMALDLEGYSVGVVLRFFVPFPAITADCPLYCDIAAERRIASR